MLLCGYEAMGQLTAHGHGYAVYLPETTQDPIDRESQVHVTRDDIFSNNAEAKPPVP